MSYVGGRLRTGSALVAVAAPVVALLTLTSRPAAASEPAPGVDCGCSTTGPFVSPVPAVDPGAAAGHSPNNVYQLAVSPSGAVPNGTPLTLSITKAGASVATIQTVAPAGWGFSPDETASS